MNRREARREIVRAANHGLSPQRTPLTQKQLQQAVSIVRNRQLVKPDVLAQAGFNMRGPNHRRVVT